MMIAGIVVCAVAQVLDPAPAPVARPAPLPVFELIDVKGQSTQGAITAFAKDGVSVRDVRGVMRTVDPAGMAAIWRVSPPPAPVRSVEPEVPARRHWVVELTDGQRFYGTLAQGASDESCVLNLDGDSARAVTVPLERIASLRLRDHPSQVASGGMASSGGKSQDVVALANGDALAGFVAALGPTVKIETAPASGATPAQVQEVALDRVIAMRLTNPAVLPKGQLVGYVDGRVILAQSFSVNEQQAALVCAIQPALTLTEPIGAVAWILPESARWRSLDALAAGPAGAVLGTPSGILLTEPGAFSWPVRTGEERFVGVLSLPPNCFDWGDFTLVIKVMQAGGREAARLRFDAETPTHAVNIELAGASSIQFVIDPGASGPIQDRLMISRGGFILPSAK